MKMLKLNKNTTQNILDTLLQRSPNNYIQYEVVVDDILENVKRSGDLALTYYTNKFEGIELQPVEFLVTEKEFETAYEKISDGLLKIIRKSLANIQEYHQRQKQNSWFNSTEDGTILGQKITPLQRVGVYVPGGTAVYPSSVLMNIVPARVAGVPEIIMTTPCNNKGEVNPAVLVAAKEAGVTQIYKVGGAQAIGALAYGTKTIKKVDKIVGPGNMYVALAKKRIFGYSSIDSIAGPSEILILADKTANPTYIAADLLSQAEHDELASAILVTTDKMFGHKVSLEVDRLTEKMERADIIKKSLNNFGCILIAETMDDAIDAVNEIASEHLEIQTADPFKTMTKIKNAGAIFLGSYSCESLGDYFAGPNHILPTNGTAKFFSPLSVDDFVKKSSIIYYSEEALKNVYEDVAQFAHYEGLTAHENAARIRFEDK
ncbi:MAG: histidinol dehydrogenase [Ruminococcus sp.]|nr:histidinol dehydrogenase [Ruminococcus sp.]